MGYIKKRLLGLLSCALIALLTMPCFAAGDETVISLQKAKELAKESSRALFVSEVTKDKLGLQAEMAHDVYMSQKSKNTINSYLQVISNLEVEIAALDPVADSARIDEIRGKIANYEQRISTLKAMMPSGSVAARYKKAWQASDDAYQDMSRVIENMEESIDLAVEKMYYALLDLQNSISLQNKALSNLGTQLKIERLKIDLGLSNKESENSIISQYTMLKNAISDLKSNEALLMWQLNDLMGRELDAPLQVIEEEISPVNAVYSVDAIYDEAVQNSLEVAQKERQIENYNNDIADEEDGDQEEILKRERKIAQTELINMQIDMKSKIKTIHDQLVSSYSAWESALFEKNKAKLSHQFMEAKYALGLVSEIQRELSSIACLEAEYKEKQAAHAWQNAHHQMMSAKLGILE